MIITTIITAAATSLLTSFLKDYNSLRKEYNRAISFTTNEVLKANLNNSADKAQNDLVDITNMFNKHTYLNNVKNNIILIREYVAQYQTYTHQLPINKDNERRIQNLISLNLKKLNLLEFIIISFK